MGSPRISVIMPFFNCEKFLNQAIRSILNQTFSDFEYIIINDASTDNSDERISPYLSDNRIRYISNSVKKGIVHNLNMGLELTQGKYIARMDGDDVCDPERLSKQYNFLESHKDIGLVGTFIKIIDEDGKEISRMKKPVDSDRITKEMFKYCTIVHGTILCKKEAMVSLGGYRSNYGSDLSQDIDFFYRFLFSGHKAINLPEFLYSYRQHAGSIAHRAKEVALKNYHLRKEMIKTFNLKPTLYEHFFMYTQLLVGLILTGRQKQTLERLVKKLFVHA